MPALGCPQCTPPGPVSSAAHLVLTGPMGVGKTAVGAKLAAALGRRFVDSDAVIEAVAGRSGKDIAAELGVARLHEMEVEALRQALHADHAAVIAAAASAALAGRLDGRARASGGSRRARRSSLRNMSRTISALIRACSAPRSIICYGYTA